MIFSFDKLKELKDKLLKKNKETEDLTHAYMPPFISGTQESEPRKAYSLQEKYFFVLKGVALGDCVGRRWEGVSPLNCQEEVSMQNIYNSPDCTDDTILTCATLYAILNSLPYANTYKSYANQYPRSDYGGRFYIWVQDGVNPHSCGNGSAMRVGPCGCLDGIDQAIAEAQKSAMCTHDDPEGIKGAIVTAVCIWMAFRGYTKEEIGEYCAKQYKDSPYSPANSYKTIRGYKEAKGNPALCQVTVPLAVNCFVHSDSFEDCLVKAISMGWDTDTQAAIAGGIAAAYYRDFSEDSNRAYDKLKELPYVKGICQEIEKIS